MDKILVLDFGGQYDQLIARRIRQEHVYAEIRAYNRITCEEIRAAGYKGIVFTGGPNSVNDPASPHFSPEILSLGIPVLGICYGEQLLAYLAGGAVGPAGHTSEYGKTDFTAEESPLFADVPKESVVWMSHTDSVKKVPEGFRVVGTTAHCPAAAIADDGRRLYGVQFHPEVTHTAYGQQILRNFLFRVCSAKADWTMEDFAERSIREWREKLRGKKVLLALSGGVDSSVAGVLLHKAIGENLTCVFVDHGLLRKDEADFVEATFRGTFGMNLVRVDASERFLTKLDGVTDPETKRKIIGEEFIRVFEAEAKKLDGVTVLAQGTIYPDVVESGKGDAAVIKSHHNVGGLPERIG
ncbi:MAG: glutamine-hydrolyzing GMP synthase, partial [Firmicutes bacterium]|nr:glutamine-hydrolyzing GMP synthase [Bacillota bacterium]